MTRTTMAVVMGLQAENDIKLPHHQAPRQALRRVRDRSGPCYQEANKECKGLRDENDMQKPTCHRTRTSGSVQGGLSCKRNFVRIMTPKRLEGAMTSVHRCSGVG